jgi:hypothetical protein
MLIGANSGGNRSINQLGQRHHASQVVARIIGFHFAKEVLHLRLLTICQMVIVVTNVLRIVCKDSLPRSINDGFKCGDEKKNSLITFVALLVVAASRLQRKERKVTNSRTRVG